MGEEGSKSRFKKEEMSISILRSFQTKGEDRQVQQTFTGKLTNGTKAWSSVYGCFE